MTELFVAVVCIYAIADFLTGIVLKRCVLPGLKCKVCRK